MSKANKKPKSAPMKGGVVHADNRGDVGKASANSETERARKRQEQLARQHAQAKKIAEECLKRHQKLEQEFDFLSQNYGEMLTGPIGNVYGLRLYKTFPDHYSPVGIIKMEIVGHGPNKMWPTIQVTGSTFDPIPKSDIFLPLSCLFQNNIRAGNHHPEVFAYKKELHTALRHFLKKEIERAKPYFDLPVPATTTTSSNQGAEMLRRAPQATVTSMVPFTKVGQADSENRVVTGPLEEEVAIDVTGALPFCIAAFMRVKENEEQIFFDRDDAGNESYFIAERIGGAQAFRLLVADEGHELHGIFCHFYGKENIRTNMLDLRKDTKPYNNDLSDVRNAREHIRQYLRGVAMKCGMRPRRTQEEMVAIAA